MIGIIKKYWPELLVFGLIFGFLLMLATPDYTWVNTDSDGVHYVYSAKYLYPAHKTSAPLYLLLGHLFLYLPIGTEAFRMALISVIASSVCAVFIYLAIKHRTGNRWHGLIGSVVYGSSALVISQSTIVESYALLTMFGVIGYYLSLKKRWALSVVALGCGLAIHPLILTALVPIFIANKELRVVKYYALLGVFLLFYLYIPITNRPPFMWQAPSTSVGQEAGSIVNDLISTALMLGGGIAVWDVPKRILDTILIFGVGIGFGLIPLFMKKIGVFKEPLFWMSILPIFFFVIDLAPQTYVYLLPAIAFSSIYLGDSLCRINKKVLVASIPIVIALWGFNINYFDIGRTLDKDMSASKYYYDELAKVPDGEAVLAQQGWEWAAIPSYNRNYDRDIVPICEGMLNSVDYQLMLNEWGIKTEDYPELGIGDRTIAVAQSIIRLNDVWVTMPTDMRTYGAEVIKANGDESLVVWDKRQVADENGQMIWQWQPSNPYDFITGAIEVSEWRDIVFSNYNMLTIFMMSVCGGVPVWILYQLIIKKKKWRFNVNGIHRKVEASKGTDTPTGSRQG